MESKVEKMSWEEYFIQVIGHFQEGSYLTQEEHDNFLALIAAATRLNLGEDWMEFVARLLCKKFGWEKCKITTVCNVNGEVSKNICFPD